MRREIDPKTTKRAMQFESWIGSPMPMVTITKTFDVTRLIKTAKKRGYKFNALLCWCILRAASQVEQFYMLPEGSCFAQYDELALNIVVSTKDDNIAFCDVPYKADFEAFYADYLRLTKQVHDSGESYLLPEQYAPVGCSALVGTEIDSIINMYNPMFGNPFLAWGRYRKKWGRYSLPVSMQFHHVQMDGAHVVKFFQLLQAEMDGVK